MIRPCLLACVPSAIVTPEWESRWWTSTQSPPAQTLSWPTQRIWTSVTRPPDAHVGPPPEPEDDDVRPDRLPVGPHRPHPAVVADVEALDAHAVAHGHPHALHRLPDDGAHVGVDLGEGLRRVVEDRHLETAQRHRLGHLDADVAGADDDRAAVAGVGQVLDDGLAVLERLHPEDALGVDPLQRRAQRAGAGGEHEVVVLDLPVLTDGTVLAAVDPAEGHDLLLEVDRRGLRAHAHLDPGLAVLLGRAGDQGVAVGARAGDPVRDPAGGD